MRKKNGIIILAVIVTLFLSCSVAAAETLTDPSGDVYHWKSTGTGFQWEASTDARSNIDITELSFTTNGDQLTLSMKVAGSIEASETISYIAWVNVSDSYYYWLTYANGEGGGFAINNEEGAAQFDYDPDISVNGNTISATFDIVGDDPSSSNLWGWAAEYTVLNDITNEWWGDWIPGEYAPFYGEINGDDDTGDDDTGDDDDGDDDTGGEADSNTNGDTPPPQTPGFEIFLLIAAFVFVVFYLRRK